VSNVLIPPKTPGGVASQEDLTIEEFKERLDAHVEERGWWEL
jgi:hypothetical protein